VSKSFVCHYFLFVDPDTMEAETVPNPYELRSADAGVKCAYLVIEKGIQTVLTTFTGTETQHILNAAGVESLAVEGVSVREALEAFRKRRASSQLD
jgi:predicted Fe-Mo cluster-binding NifX family protein